MSGNSLFLLKPYKLHGSWDFDDPAVGLHQEPFVLGIDEMLDRLTSGIPDARNGFRLIFSPTPFPGYEAKLELARPEYGGNWYYSPTYKIEGWLCPALFKYVDQAPAELYAKAEPARD